MSRAKRRITFIDRNVQGALGLRLGAYCALFLLGVFCILAGVPLIYYLAFPSSAAPSSTEILWISCREFWPIAFAACLVMPFVVQDIFRLSNRFVGPIYRLRTVMRQLSEGETPGPIRFRDGDYWHGLATYLNIISERLALAESRLAAYESLEESDREPVLEDEAEDQLDSYEEHGDSELTSSDAMT